MKKKLLLAIMMFASVMSFAKILATWTSTCGHTHYTTFPDNADESDIAYFIILLNEKDCGVRCGVQINP